MVFSATNKKGQAPLKELKNKKTKQYALLLLKNGMVGKNIKGYFKTKSEIKEVKKKVRKK